MPTKATRSSFLISGAITATILTLTLTLWLYFRHNLDNFSSKEDIDRIWRYAQIDLGGSRGKGTLSMKQAVRTITSMNRTCDVFDDPCGSWTDKMVFACMPSNSIYNNPVRAFRCFPCRSSLDCQPHRICEPFAFPQLLSLPGSADTSRNAINTNNTNSSSSSISSSRNNQTWMKEADEPRDALHSVCRLKYSNELVFDSRIQQTLIIIWVATAVANAGGLAGGTLFVPIIAFLLKYPIPQAAGLSQALIAGNSLSTSVYQLFYGMHPARDRPSVSFEVLVSAVPSLILGSTFGVIGFKLFTDYVSTFCLFFVLVLVSISSVKEAKKAREDERTWKSDDMLTMDSTIVKEVKDNKESSTSSISLSFSSLPSIASTAVPIDSSPPLLSKGSSKVWRDDALMIHQVPMQSNELAKYSTSFDYVGGRVHAMNILQRLYLMTENPRVLVQDVSLLYETEKRRFPLFESLVLALSWIIMFVFSYSRLSSPVCSYQYIASVFLQQAALYFLVFRVRRYLCLWFDHKIRLGFVFHAKDIQWSYPKARSFSLVCILVGFIASFVGIGPAALLTPLLLHSKYLNMHPIIAQATSSPINLIFSSNVLIPLYLSNIVEWRVSLIFAVVSFTASLAGLLASTWIIKRYQMQWLIITVLSGVLVISCILALLLTMQQVVHHLAHHSLYIFRSLC